MRDVNMINKDVILRIAIVSSETFSDLPVASFQDVVGLQSGFVTGSDGSLHAAGGRAAVKVAYLIDGVPVRDPLKGGFTGNTERDAIRNFKY